MNKLQLGNMGFSDVVCKDIAIGIGVLQLSCHTGTIHEIHSFGLTPKDGEI